VDFVKESVEVGICGTGPVWEGIEAGLQEKRGFRVRWLGSSLAEAVREVLMLSPHALFFDISSAEPAVVAAILRKLPGTKLIGLNAEGDAITVFSASEQPVFSVEELMRVIKSRPGRQGRLRRGIRRTECIREMRGNNE
jgi:hypothetical protein